MDDPWCIGAIVHCMWKDMESRILMRVDWEERRDVNVVARFLASG
jgi:hypothetical protein